MSNFTDHLIAEIFDHSVRDDAKEERIPSYNMFNRIYYNIRRYIVPCLFKTLRTYEAPYKQYYIVLVPLKGRTHSIAMIHAMFKKNGLERIIVTLEKTAGAPHYNVIVTTKYDYGKLHNKVYKKYKLNVQTVITRSSINRILDYIFKESKERDFVKGEDYIIYCKP